MDKNDEKQDVYKRQAVATGHSGNSSFARIILTSESIVTHSFLSVQLQKGAYLFLNV